MTTKFLCKFKLNGTTYETASERGIGVFQDGFWVDEDFELTADSLRHCKTWIPPHKIECIIKVTDDFR